MRPRYLTLLYLDFETGAWARYVGRVRSLHGTLAPGQALVMRERDWTEALYTLRHTPQYYDPQYKEPA